MKLLLAFLNLLLWPFKEASSFLIKIFITILLLILFFMATCNWWLPTVFEVFMKAKTGFNVSVGESDCSLFEGNINFQEMLLENPRQAFYSKNFIDLNEIGIDIKVTSLISKTLVIDNLIIDLDDISIVKNGDGIRNTEMFSKNLLANKAKKLAKNPNKKIKKQSPQQSHELLIKNVTIKLKTVHIIDEQLGDPASKTFTVNYSRTFKDVSDLNKIQKALINDLAAYGIANLIESSWSILHDLPIIKQGFNGVEVISDASQKAVKQVTNTLTKPLKFFQTNK